jgi:hypothetical protein
MRPWEKLPRAWAALGAVAWAALWAFPSAKAAEIQLIERLLLLAPFVTVPLALLATARAAAGDARPPPVLWRAACVVGPPAAALLAASLRLLPGRTAGALAAPWIATTGILALLGLQRRLRGGVARALVPFEEACIDAGHAYLAIGGAWLAIERFGLAVLGFGPTIALLTAVHFHYAGFAAPIIAGLAGRTLLAGAGAAAGTAAGPASTSASAAASSPASASAPAPSPRLRRAYFAAAGAVALGPPLIAAGITVSPLLEVAAAFALAAGLLLFCALLVLRVAPALGRAGHPVARALLTLAGTALVVTMAAACAYALGEFQGRVYLGIPRMAEIHGAANALGFSLGGLAAFAIVRPAPRAR